MERQLYRAILALLSPLDKTPSPTRHEFPDARILAIVFWACLHDRPVSWACARKNGPLDLRRPAPPSPSTLSRRLRRPSAIAPMADLLARVLPPAEPGAFGMIDGKPPVIGGASGDREGVGGRAVNGMARGYKLHALLNPQGDIAACEVTAMNVDERVVAERLIRQAGVQGDVLADANYDSNTPHAVCDTLGDLQLLTPRRFAAAKGTGHRPQAPGRQRCLEAGAAPEPRYLDGRLDGRDAIERHFANLTNWGGGLGPLPAWVRTQPRVEAWVAAKLAIAAVKRRYKITTCDA